MVHYSSLYQVTTVCSQCCSATALCRTVWGRGWRGRRGAVWGAWWIWRLSSSTSQSSTGTSRGSMTVYRDMWRTQVMFFLFHYQLCFSGKLQPQLTNQNRQCQTQNWGRNVYKKIVKTHRNSTQLKPTLKQLALELDTVVTWNPPTTHPTPNFSATSNQAIES